MKKLLAVLLVLTLLLSCSSALADSVRIKEGSNPNVRTKPSTEGDILGNAKSGQTYELLDKSDNWYKIQLNASTQGWISGGMVAEVIKSAAETKAPAAPQATEKPAQAQTSQSAAAAVEKTLHHLESAAITVPAGGGYFDESEVPKLIQTDSFSVRLESINIYDQDGRRLILGFTCKDARGVLSWGYQYTLQISDVKVNGVAYPIDEDKTSSPSLLKYNNMYQVVVKAGEEPLPADVMEIKTVEFSISAPPVDQNAGKAPLFVIDHVTLTVKEEELAFHLEQAESTILQAGAYLNESYSAPFFNVDGRSAYVRMIGSDTVAGQPAISITLSYRNDQEGAGSYYPEISDVKINGVACLVKEEERYGVYQGEEVPEEYVVYPTEGNSLPGLNEIRTVEFSLQATHYNDRYAKVPFFAIDHVTITVDPNMERGEARAVSYTEKGMAVRADGSIAFTYGDEYDEATYSFKEGLCVVRHALSAEDYLYGAIDTNGNIVVPVEYERLNACSEGMMGVRKDGKWGYLDASGAMVIEPQYDYVYSFSDGVAGVCTGTTTLTGGMDVGTVRFIDKAGQTVEALGEWERVNAFSNGFSRVRKDGKWVFIDREGNVVVEPAWDSGSNFINGYAYLRKDGLFTYADTTGRILSEPVFEEATPFNRFGTAVVKQDGKYRMVDTELNTVADLSEYNYINWRFDTDFAMWMCYSGKMMEEYGIPDYDNMGTYDILDAKGSKVASLNAGYNVTIIANQGIIFDRPYNHEVYGEEAGNTGMIDFEGNTVIPFQYETIEYTGQDDLYLTRSGHYDRTVGAFVYDYTIYSISKGEIAHVDPGELETMMCEFSEGVKMLNPRQK